MYSTDGEAEPPSTVMAWFRLISFSRIACMFIPGKTSMWPPWVLPTVPNRKRKGRVPFAGHFKAAESLMEWSGMYAGNTLCLPGLGYSQTKWRRREPKGERE